MGSNIYNVCYKYSYYIIYINKQYIYLFHDNPTLYSATKYHKIALVLVKKINQFRFWWLFSLLAKPSNHQVHISKYSKGTIEFPFSVSNSSVTWSQCQITFLRGMVWIHSMGFTSMISTAFSLYTEKYGAL